MAAKEGGEGGGAGAGGLIPGLPEELVLAQVVVRLPWYARPVCRAVSKSWRACLDTSMKHPDLQLKSRECQLPLLHGCIVLCTFDNRIFILTKDCMPQRSGARYRSVQWQKFTHQIPRQWRKLPPLQGFLPKPARVTLIASSGMAYAWSSSGMAYAWSNREREKFVLKMDMGCGDWTWNKFPVPHPFNEKAVPFNGKIYVPGVPSGESGANEWTEMVLVYDMMTDQCGPTKAFNRDYLGVLWKKSPDALSGIIEQELYSFVEHDSEMEIFIYDTCGDSWRSQGKIPIPECRRLVLEKFKLVNGDCFEPAPDAGINTIWVDSEGDVISWFNPSLHETWVEFSYNISLEGKSLEYVQFIHGSLYGIFCEDKYCQDDEEEEDMQGKKEEEGEDRSYLQEENDEEEEDMQGKKEEEGEDRSYLQDSILFKRTLMKGTMSVSGKMVNWEDVLDIGWFFQAHYHNPSVVLPINCYTIMD